MLHASIDISVAAASLLRTPMSNIVPDCVGLHLLKLHMMYLHQSELTQINTKKMTTLDYYPSRVIKKFLCEPLTDIINAMFEHQK